MFRRLASIPFILCAALWLSAGLADEADNTPPQDEEGSEKGVIIKAPEQETISEFRINGKLYMIRITPRKGAPYYLVDSDGDGDLETRWNDLSPNLLIPAWVIKKW